LGCFSEPSHFYKPPLNSGSENKPITTGDQPPFLGQVVLTMER
jgi:hypothetical protein